MFLGLHFLTNEAITVPREQRDWDLALLAGRHYAAPSPLDRRLRPRRVLTERAPLEDQAPKPAASPELAYRGSDLAQQPENPWMSGSLSVAYLPVVSYRRVDPTAIRVRNPRIRFNILLHLLASLG
jgi:hypothetical protein